VRRQQAGGARPIDELEAQGVARAVRVLARIVLARDHLVADEGGDSLAQLDMLGGRVKSIMKRPSVVIRQAVEECGGARKHRLDREGESFPDGIGTPAAAMQVHVETGIAPSR
jgi:hypothetical protein